MNQSRLLYLTYNENEAPRPAPPPPRFARCASSSGPPPPLSRGRKGEAFSQRDPRRSLIHGEARIGKFASLSTRHLLFSSLNKRGEAERRQTQNQPPRLRARRALSRARTPVGVPPRFLHRRTNATAQPQAALSGTRLKDGRYPSPPVPVQRASRRPVIMPAGRLPRAARERTANPPAGTAPTPPHGMPPVGVPW